MSEVVKYTENDQLLTQADTLGLHVPAKVRKAIKSAGQKPVRDYSKEELRDTLASFLKGLFRDLGMAKPPDAYDGARFMQAVRDHYPDLTISDLKAAFELAMLGELDVQMGITKEKDRHHFQSFSFQYYSRVLSAYRRFQRENMHDLNGKVQLILKDLNQQGRRGIWTFKMYLVIRRLVRQYLRTGKDEFIVHDGFIRVMRYLKVIDGMQAPTPEDIRGASYRMGVRRSETVKTALQNALEAGKVSDDVRASATVQATKRKALLTMKELGLDEMEARFKTALMAIKHHHKLTDDEAEEAVVEEDLVEEAERIKAVAEARERAEARAMEQAASLRTEEDNLQSEAQDANR